MYFEPETVTKTAAASRQLREAIHLFFEQRDRVSIHTLAAAALQVFSDVARIKDITSMLKSGVYVRDEKKREWFAILNEPQNFFKHADNDPDSTIDFKPNVTPFFLVDAVLLQAQLGERTLSSDCFLLWFYSAFPDLLTPEPMKEFLKQQMIEVDPRDFPLFLKHLRQIDPR